MQPLKAIQETPRAVYKGAYPNKTFMLRLVYECNVWSYQADWKKKSIVISTNKKSTSC